MNKISKKWFTLIEVIVSMTIIWVIMVWIITTFIMVWNLNNKADINRHIQENIRRFTHSVSEDLRVWGISFDTNSSLWHIINTGLFDVWEEIFAWDKEYFMAEEWLLIKVNSSNPDSCINRIEKECVLAVRDTTTWNIKRFSDKKVQIKNLKTLISKWQVPKATISFEISPSYKTWLPQDLIINNTIYFQTTLSENILNHTK